MSDPLCSLYDIMMRMAEDVDEIEFFRITAISTGGTQFLECGSQSSATSNVYRYGVGRVSGKGARKIAASGGTYTSGTGTGGKFTLDTVLSSAAAVGETLDVAWWNEKGYGKALAAAKAAIDSAYPYYFRECRLDLNTNIISDGTTFTMLDYDEDVDEYTPPTDLVRLGKIGIQNSVDEEVRWIDRLDWYDLFGREQGNVLKFYRSASGDYLPSLYNGKTICWHYEAREPIPTTLVTASCQIPLEAVGLVAANIYKRRNLFKADSELRTEGAAIPQLQAAASEAWARLGYIKQPLQQGVTYRKR